MSMLNIAPDRKRARSILRTVALLEKRIGLQEGGDMAGLIVADYYEIAKELCTALLLLDGRKTLSHRELLDAVGVPLRKAERELLHELRILRNRVMYDGFRVRPTYLRRKKRSFFDIVRKLKEHVGRRL